MKRREAEPGSQRSSQRGRGSPGSPARYPPPAARARQPHGAARKAPASSPRRLFPRPARLPGGEAPPPPGSSLPRPFAFPPSGRPGPAGSPHRGPPPHSDHRPLTAAPAPPPPLTFSQRLFTCPSESCLHSLSCSTHWSSSLVKTFSSIPLSPSSPPAAAATTAAPTPEAPYDPHS